MTEGKYLNIFGNTEDIPSSSSLVSLRLLRDANNEAFGDLAREETRFLSSAMSLVRNDPLLKLKMGGDTLTASTNLAKLLRERAERRAFNKRIDPIVDELVKNELHGYGDDFKKPKKSVMFNGKNLTIDMNRQSKDKVVFGDLIQMQKEKQNDDEESQDDYED